MPPRPRKVEPVPPREGLDVQGLFAQACSASSAAIVLSELETGRFVAVNDAFCSLTGFSRDELLGKSAIELNMWEPGKREVLADRLRRDGTVRDLELRALHKDGGAHTGLVSAD